MADRPVYIIVIVVMAVFLIISTWIIGGHEDRYRKCQKDYNVYACSYQPVKDTP